MHFIDRWILSQAIATVSLLILVLAVGVPRHLWLDMLHMWCMVLGLNQIRLTFTRDRRVGYHPQPDAAVAQ